MLLVWMGHDKNVDALFFLVLWLLLGKPGKLREDMDSEEYKEWYEGYKEECECNYKASYNGMEKTILVILSEDLKLRYTTFIGDGDVKTVAC